MNSVIKALQLETDTQVEFELKLQELLAEFPKNYLPNTLEKNN